METHLIEQIDERLAGGRQHAGRGRELLQFGEPFQRIVGRGAAAQPLQGNAPMNPRAFHAVMRVVEVRRAGGAEHPRAARLGPVHGGIEQLAQRFRGHGFQVVQNHQRGRLPQGGGGGVGVDQALAQHRTQGADRHAHGIAARYRVVAQDHGGLEQSGAREPAPGFLGQRGFALTAKAGERDAPGLLREPAFDVPQLAPTAKEPGFGTGRQQ